MTQRRSLIVLAASIALPAARAVAQRRRLPRVALVLTAAPLVEIAGADPADSNARAFIHRLRDLGLVDGRDVVIERRSAEGRPERLDRLTQEVVTMDVDVIVTAGGPAVRAAQRATDRIAIVAFVNQPVDGGLVASLARPGGNLTGIGLHSPEIYGKELQLLKEAAPAISRVAVIDFRLSSGPAARRRRDELDDAARALRLELLWLGVDSPDDLQAAFETIVRERADALFAMGTHVNSGQRQRIADFAAGQRLPSVGFAQAGMLLDYGDDMAEIWRRIAALVKKILDGARPAELPFEQATKFLLTINLRTAKALGITIPQALLLRADEVIE